MASSSKYKSAFKAPHGSGASNVALAEYSALFEKTKARNEARLEERRRALVAKRPIGHDMADFANDADTVDDTQSEEDDRAKRTKTTPKTKKARADCVRCGVCNSQFNTHERRSQWIPTSKECERDGHGICDTCIVFLVRPPIDMLQHCCARQCENKVDYFFMCERLRHIANGARKTRAEALRTLATTIETVYKSQ